MTDNPVNVVLKVRTLLRLGVLNILRVGAYRALLKLGVYRRILPIEPVLGGPFFNWPESQASIQLPDGVDAVSWARDAERVMRGELLAFSYEWVKCGFPPNWHRSVISQIDLIDARRHWTQLPDFNLPGGDVKGYWEPARFDGLVILALGWITTRREDFKHAIERWLTSWAENNPANAGVQWKCGQEAGLRLMQTILVAELLQRWGSVRTTESFRKLVVQHCRRIAPTMLYAIGQDNNHGTSEAAALFIGGVFLEHHSADHQRQAAAWRNTGRHWLENRLQRLVLPDGSFSQQSVNYHRLMLDTYSFAETYRHDYKEEQFSPRFQYLCSV